jgi:hypothetical protein
VPLAYEAGAFSPETVMWATNGEAKPYTFEGEFKDIGIARGDAGAEM